MKITIVKKVKIDGCLCRKSAQVWQELQEAKLLNYIDSIVFAHPHKAKSEGMSLAIQYQVAAAPFFLVEQAGTTQVYTDSSRFLKEVLHYDVEANKNSNTVSAGADFDFIEGL